MANTRLPMRNIREVLRLKHQIGLSNRQISESLRVAHSTVSDYLRRAKAAGISWPLPENLSDLSLENRLFADSQIPAKKGRAQPDYAYVYDELRSYKNVNLTLDLLWREYKEQNPEGYQYSRFCDKYSSWRGKLDYCMRQEHRAGEKVFVDYAKGLSIVNPLTGELTVTHLFVAVWGASNYTYAEASLSQDLSCWIGSHVRALNYFACGPLILVPDCLKSGVSQACFYEPEINPTYADFAHHYGAAILPARPKHPRDKAKVETGVLIAKRWILAVLRHRTFTSLAELNVAIRELLPSLNGRLLRKMKKSRKELFESLDRLSAQALPSLPYEYAEWKKATVNIDYHIEVDRHYYSVPFRWIREKLDVRITASIVEVFRKGERIAAHPRSRAPHKHTTLKEHMPPDHRKYAEWTPSRIIRWAGQTGPATVQLVEKILASRTYPEQGYRSCLGVLRLGKNYGPQRLEAASLRAIQFNTYSFKAVRSILDRGLDRQTDAPASDPQKSLPFHDNVRGGAYFH
jgi:transposase